jgi:hypothetical protein
MNGALANHRDIAALPRQVMSVQRQCAREPAEGRQDQGMRIADKARPPEAIARAAPDGDGGMPMPRQRESR